MLSARFVIVNESVKVAGLESLIDGPWSTTILLAGDSLMIALPIATLIGNRRHLKDLAQLVFGRLQWWQVIIVGCVGSVATDFVTDRVIRGLGVEPIFDIARDLTDF